VPRVIDQVDGFDIKVNIVEDRDEPHVHVYKGGLEYRVSLATCRIMTYGGSGKSTKAQGRRVERLVAEHLEACWTEWNKWHKSSSRK
jgi:hypothetical protein